MLDQVMMLVMEEQEQQVQLMQHQQQELEVVEVLVFLVVQEELVVVEQEQIYHLLVQELQEHVCLARFVRHGVDSVLAPCMPHLREHPVAPLRVERLPQNVCRRGRHCALQCPLQR